MQRYLRTALEVRCNNVSRERIHQESEPVNGSSNVYWLQLYNAETGALIRNMSSKVAPWFNITGIELTTRVSAVITAVNRQGRSESITLEGALERAVGSRSGTINSSTFRRTDLERKCDANGILTKQSLSVTRVDERAFC